MALRGAGRCRELGQPAGRSGRRGKPAGAGARALARFTTRRRPRSQRGESSSPGSPACAAAPSKSSPKRASARAQRRAHRVAARRDRRVPAPRDLRRAVDACALPVGQQADALRTFSELQDRLGEIGLRPSARAARAHRRRSPPEAASRAVPCHRPASGGDGPNVSPRCPIGRREELRDLLDAHDRAGKGERGFVVVSGPAGIGKTTLAASSPNGPDASARRCSKRPAGSTTAEVTKRSAR